MGWMVGVGLIALMAAVMAGLLLLARRVKRRGTAGQAIAAAMAAYDQGFHSTAYDTYVEVQSQDERTQQSPSPDEPR
ncbi:MAG: hypothetical protein QM607_05370 [Microbacterium sp.]